MLHLTIAILVALYVAILALQPMPVTRVGSREWAGSDDGHG